MEQASETSFCELSFTHDCIEIVGDKDIPERIGTAQEVSLQAPEFQDLVYGASISDAVN